MSFSGRVNDNVEEFITHESECNCVTALSDAKLSWAIPLLLSHSSLNFQRMKGSAQKSWQQTVNAFRESYTDQMYEEGVIDKIRARIQGENKLDFDCISSIRLLMTKVSHRLDENIQIHKIHKMRSEFLPLLRPHLKDNLKTFVSIKYSFINSSYRAGPNTSVVLLQCV